ncbi:PD40 domain-containing protein [bacterium]|nr:PD40 domain-containing protein [bacterium]
MMNKKKYAFLITVILNISFLIIFENIALCREIKITISKKLDRKIRVAILPFFAKKYDNSDILTARELYSTIKFDIKNSGYFELWPQKTKFTDKILKKGKNIDSADYDFWFEHTTELVIKGYYDIQGTEVFIKFVCFDIAAQSVILSEQIVSARKNLRTAAHSLCGKLIKLFSGARPPITNTSIAYVKEVNGIKNIFITDYDGQNARQLTFNSNLTINPAWHNTSLFYVSYKENGYPFVFMRDLTSANIKKISARPGLNAFPAVSPDGKKIALTLSFNGNPEIYILNIDGSILKRVTYNPATDTSPAWAPESNRIAFVSDRTGTPQIYTVDYRTGTPKRVSYRGSYNTSPDWCPTKKSSLIVYTSLYGKNSELYLLDVNNGNIKRLTTTLESEESPSWAPDGIHISYTLTQNFKSDIYFMDVRDSIAVQITDEENNCTSSTWGPN